jgi:two-component system CheB/CheR fusion protein
LLPRIGLQTAEVPLKKKSEKAGGDTGPPMDIAPALGEVVVCIPPAKFSGFIVAVGASAGGLEALERFFNHCPPDTGAAFVVIQHLSPDHKSMMHDLLGRYTAMAVNVVADAMPVEANNVYLIPPGTIMRIDDGQLFLTPKNPHLLTLPIDIFLTSLADEQGPKSIGVILSGTGSDGTRGAAAVNAAGGFLLAQEPKDARFDGMPSSVIATGLVDSVLTADQLGPRLVAHINNVPIQAVERIRPALRIPLSEEDALEGILQLLLQAGGIDFHDYKQATLMRRIERRMQVRHLRTLDDYLGLLESDRTELSTLRRELLIPVTSFFRDGEAFESLRTDVVEPLVKVTGSGETIRVWVAACSTGEEAYSIAMLFMEAFEAHKRWPNLKVFATDVNQQNVDFAGAGQFPDSAAAELTPERIERFFQRTDSAYTVKAELRQNIVFARHNLLADPPFTRMSLVSCRNALIYFTPDAQRRALNRLQYAMKQDGFLFLGSSESIAGSNTSLDVVHAKHKLFKRTDVSVLPGFASADVMRGGYVPTLKSGRSKNTNTALDDGAHVDTATQTLLNEYAPPSMLVNDRHEVIHMFGDVSPFFKARPGTASLELNRILPAHIVPVASAMLYKAGKEKELTTSDFLRLSMDDPGEITVRLAVRPTRTRGEERLMLLSFEVQRGNAGSVASTLNVNAETIARVDVLERELSATRESLQATIEELETSNEELQATNEELMASNEELQSSNEELQSVNEELNTVNAEFQEKMGILNRVNADLDTMTKAVGVATVFVDDAMQLTRFSPDAATIFKLRDTDAGRPLDEIAHVLKYPGLMEDMRLTLATGRMMETETIAPDGRAFLVRILAYGVPSTRTRGVVATFVDITAFHDRQRLQDVLDALPEHVAVLDCDGTIVMVNAAWIRFAKANGDSDLKHSGVGANYLHACAASPTTEGSREAAQARLGIKGVLEGTATGFSLRYPCHSPTEQRWFLMNVAPIRGQHYGAVVSHINITAWSDAQLSSTVTNAP